MIKHSGKPPLRRRNSCTALKSSKTYQDSQEDTLRPPRFRSRRLSVKESMTTTYTDSPSYGDNSHRLSFGTANKTLNNTSNASSQGNASNLPFYDPSLRVSTILKRWNSHRERRLSANDASEEAGYFFPPIDTPPTSRKLSAW